MIVDGRSDAPLLTLYTSWPHFGMSRLAEEAAFSLSYLELGNGQDVDAFLLERGRPLPAALIVRMEPRGAAMPSIVPTTPLRPIMLDPQPGERLRFDRTTGRVLVAD